MKRTFSEKLLSAVLVIVLTVGMLPAFPSVASADWEDGAAHGRQPRPDPRRNLRKTE